MSRSRGYMDVAHVRLDEVWRSLSGTDITKAERELLERLVGAVQLLANAVAEHGRELDAMEAQRQYWQDTVENSDRVRCGAEANGRGRVRCALDCGHGGEHEASITWLRGPTVEGKP